MASIALLRQRIAADLEAGEKLKELAVEIVRLKAARSHMLEMFNLHAIAHLIYGEVEVVDLDKQINDSVNELLEKVIAWCPERGLLDD